MVGMQQCTLLCFLRGKSIYQRHMFLNTARVTYLSVRARCMWTGTSEKVPGSDDEGGDLLSVYTTALDYKKLGMRSSRTQARYSV
jgi:hypothetical protein